MKQVVLFAFLYLICTFTVRAQQHIVRGLVQNTEGEALDYFSVTIIRVQDTSVVKSAYYTDGRFTISCNTSALQNITISHPLYHTAKLSLEFTAADTLDIGTVVMVANMLLDEVVIRPPQIVRKDDKLMVTIENTTLSDAGTAVDVLKSTPLVLVDSKGKVSLAGKGNTLILIDGRRIKNQNELQTLSSNTIKRVEIIETPSAKYEADGHAVINIVTTSSLLKGLSTSLYGRFKRGRDNSCNFSVEESLNAGKSAIYAMYAYANPITTTYSNADYIIDTDSYSFNSIANGESHSSESVNSYKFSYDYQFNNRHSLGVQAIGSFSDENSNGSKSLKVTRNSLPQPILYTINGWPTNIKQNSVNLNYLFKDSVGNELQVLGDYTRYTTADNTTIDEWNDNATWNSEMQNANDYQVNVYSIKADGTLKLPLKLKLEVGGKLSAMGSSNIGHFSVSESGVWQPVDQYSNDIDYAERLLAGYSIISKTYSKLNLSIGLRYEQLWVHNTSKNQTVVDTTYGEFFPSFSANLKLSEKLDARLAYTRRINRPAYDDLDASFTYLDSLTSRRGNPLLQPTIYNTLSTSLTTQSGINVELNASYVEAPVVFMYLSDSIYLEKITYMKKNAANTFSYGATISAGFKWGKCSVQPYGSISFQPMSIEDNGINYSFNYPTYYLQVASQYSILPTLQLDMNVTFSRDGGGYIETGKQLDYAVGLRKKLLKNKLTCMLRYSGSLFNWTQHVHYGYKNHMFTYDMDNNMLSVSLRYNFNSKLLKFNDKSGSLEEAGRL